MRLKPIIRAILAIAFVSAAASRAQDVSSTPDLAPPNGEYTESSLMLFPGLGTSVTLSGLDLRGLVAANAGNNFPATTGTEHFTSFFDVFVSLNGGPAVETLGSGSVDLNLTRTAGTGDTGTVDTQVTDLDFTASFPGHTIEVKSDPAQTSTGQTTISNLGGGEFRINSFFDIFTELSLDSGPFMRLTNGPAILTLQPVPETTSTLSLFILSIAFGGLGLGCLGWLRKPV